MSTILNSSARDGVQCSTQIVFGPLNQSIGRKHERMFETYALKYTQVFSSGSLQRIEAQFVQAIVSIKFYPVRGAGIFLIERRV